MLGAKGFTLDKNLFRQREIMFNTFISLLELVSSVSNKFVYVTLQFLQHLLLNSTTSEERQKKIETFNKKDMSERNDSSKLIFKVKPVTKQSQLRARRNLTIAAKQIQKFAAKANEKDAIQTRILLGNRCLVSRTI